MTQLKKKYPGLLGVESVAKAKAPRENKKGQEEIQVASWPH